MSRRLTVTFLETHVNEETYVIKELPNGWDDMDNQQLQEYLSKHGEFIDSRCDFSHVDSVRSVHIDEEASA